MVSEETEREVRIFPEVMEVTGAGRAVGAGVPTPLHQEDSSGGTVVSWNSQCSPAYCTDDSFLVLLLHYERESEGRPWWVRW